MSALTTHMICNQRENKKKRIKKVSTSDRKPKKGKEQDHLKKASLGPLRQGQWLDTSETKPCSSKEHNHQTKARTPQRAPPSHMQAPLSQSTLPLNHCSNATRECNKEQKSAHFAQGG
jgi:hypothetical protein